MAQAQINYYLDADILGLAKYLSQVRPDLTYPGDPGGVVRGKERPASPIATTDVPDHTWIPEIARRGWTIITRDRRIEHRPAERDAVIAYGAKVVAITSHERLDLWHQLEVVMCRWRDIERIHGEDPGPRMFSITRTSTRRLL